MTFYASIQLMPDDDLLFNSIGIIEHRSCPPVSQRRLIVRRTHKQHKDVSIDENELAAVGEHGCDAAQGYLLGAPISANEFDNLIEQQGWLFH